MATSTNAINELRDRLGRKRRIHHMPRPIPEKSIWRRLALEVRSTLPASYS
jgi:hypothetical protein